MRKLTLVLPLMLVLVASQPAYSVLNASAVSENSTKDNADSINAITGLVKNYYDGMFFGDDEKLEKSFYKDARVSGYLKNKEEHLTSREWIEKIRSSPAPASRGDKYDYRIGFIDVTEKTAVVKVFDTYLGINFVDYLEVMKVNGQWVILGKVFYSE